MLGFGLLAYPRFKQRPHNQLDLSGECLLIKEPQQAALRGDRLSRWELCCGNAKPGEGCLTEAASCQICSKPSLPDELKDLIVKALDQIDRHQGRALRWSKELPWSGTHAPGNPLPLGRPGGRNGK